MLMHWCNSWPIESWSSGKSTHKTCAASASRETWGIPAELASLQAGNIPGKTLLPKPCTQHAGVNQARAPKNVIFWRSCSPPWGQTKLFVDPHHCWCPASFFQEKMQPTQSGVINIFFKITHTANPWCPRSPEAIPELARYRNLFHQQTWGSYCCWSCQASACSTCHMKSRAPCHDNGPWTHHKHVLVSHPGPLGQTILCDRPSPTS